MDSVSFVMLEDSEVAVQMMTRQNIFIILGLAFRFDLTISLDVGKTTFLSEYLKKNHIRNVDFVSEKNQFERDSLQTLKRLRAFSRFTTFEDLQRAHFLYRQNFGNLECSNKRTSSLMVTKITSYNSSIFMKLSSEEYFRTAPWIVFGSLDLLVSLKNVYLALDNEVIFALSDIENGQNLELWEGYKAAPNLPLHVTQVGTWSAEEGLDQWGPKEPFSRRTDLTGLHLRATTGTFAPFITATKKKDGTLSVSGNNADLFDLLRQTLNFTVTFHPPKNGLWGSLNPNTGMMSGMVGDLQKGSADIAVNAIDVTLLRSEYVDFLIPLDSFGYLLVMRTPGKEADWRSYTAVFRTETWSLIFVNVFILAVALHFISKFSPRENVCTLSDSAMVMVSAACNAGYPRKFHCMSTRVMVVTIFLTAYTVYTYYSSFLIAALTIEKIGIPFSDLQGLHANRKDYRLGMMGDSSLADLLRNSKDPFLKRLWTDMLKPHPENLIPSNELGLQRIREEPLVFLTYAPTYLPSDDVLSLKKQYFKVPLSWAVQKNSSLLPIFNYQFHKWLESGLYRRHFQKIVPKPASEEIKGKVLGMSEMFTAFFMFSLELLFAVIVLVLEITTTKIKMKNFNKFMNEGIINPNVH